MEVAGKAHRPVEPSSSSSRVVRILLQGTASGAFAVSRDSPVLIGRGERAKLRLNDFRVSRAHCRIELGEAGLPEVVDLSSANGTFVNGHMVMRSPLRDGDELRIGDSTLRVSIERDEAAESEAVFDREFACRDCGRSIALATFAEGEVLEMAGRFICPECVRAAGKVDGGADPVEQIVEQLRADGYVDIQRLKVPGASRAIPLFRAKRASLGQPVAIKAIAPGRGVREKQVQRFLREARIVARLSHPNIVRVYDVCRSGSILYFVMEALDGLTLLQEIQARRRIDVRRALAVALPVVRALVYSHGQGVIHRDLKPANIMVTDAGVVKLIDFGLAKMLRSIADRAITQEGEALGTLAYAPPEQLRDASTVDERADLFSFGATLYHMLAGRPPFGGARGHELPALPVESAPPDALETIVPGLPKEVADLVARCMTRDPKERFASAADLLSALEEAIRRVHGFPSGKGSVDVLVHFGPEEGARDETMKLPAFGAPRKEAPLPASGFFGLFTKQELFELFQMVDQNAKTGRLEISDPRGRKGAILFKDGKVIKARYRDVGGETALYALLGLEEGHFRFLSTPVEDRPEHALAIAPLLMEALRRRDEAARASGSETMH